MSSLENLNEQKLNKHIYYLPNFLNFINNKQSVNKISNIIKEKREDEFQKRWIKQLNNEKKQCVKQTENMKQK
jgi:hypothetical protein